MIVVDADDFEMVFTGPGNFRFDIAKEQPYKGNREDFEKPYHWASVDEFIKSEYRERVFTCEGYEADDYLAFHRTEDNVDRHFICTRDKDLLTVPGWHYRWACGESQPEVLPHFVSEYEAFTFFFKQCLMGDSTDNIPGCGRKEEVEWGGKLQMRRKGIGPKAAEKMLNGVDTISEQFDIVKAAYKERFPEEDYMGIFLENARLLYMGQRADHLFEWEWLDPFLHLRKEEDDKT